MERNKREETKLRVEYKNADRRYTENLANYDAEMKEQTRNKEQATEQYEQMHHELTLITDEYKQRIEERKKREEILAIMQKKNDEQLK
jgi:hypothetical protein